MGFSAACQFFFLRIAKEPGQLVMYHLCFCKVIYMWCTSYSWEKKLNLPLEYQALKSALFLHANTQCPDQQNATNQSGRDMNVTMYQNHETCHNIHLLVGAHQCWVSLTFERFKCEASDEYTMLYNALKRIFNV